MTSKNRHECACSGQPYCVSHGAAEWGGGENETPVWGGPDLVALETTILAIEAEAAMLSRSQVVALALATPLTLDEVTRLHELRASTAVAAALARVRERVAGLPPCRTRNGWEHQHQAAVLAIIDEESA